MSRPIVAARGLTRQYPGVLALDHADLEIWPGDIVGLVGKNGAGKSTLIKILAGAEVPDAGTLEIEGKQVALGHGYDTPEAHRRGLAFMHQELANVPSFTVAENVAMGSRFPRRFGWLVNWGALNANVRKALDQLELDVSPEAYLADLTSVQQRMVMIARALYHDARLLVLDEPSTSLTDHEITRLHEIIRDLAGRGHAVVYVSHRLREIVDLTTKVVVMENGRVTMARDCAGLSERDIVAAIAGGKSNALVDTPKHSKTSAQGKVLLRATGLGRGDRVKNATFELREGEILGIAGLVGSGRTELMRLLFGADERDTGTIEVTGKEVAIRSPREAIDAGIVLLPEDRRGQGLALKMSVRENITLASLPAHRTAGTPFPSRRSESRISDQMVSELTIKTPSIEQEVGRLSGGNQQKVVLSRWLARGGKVFIFDEPSQGVDVHAKEEIFRLIEACASGTNGAIVVSSDFTELLRICDRLIVMREGALVGQLEHDAMSESAILETIYG